MNLKNIILLLLLVCFSQTHAQHTLTIRVDNCKKGIGNKSLRSIQLYHRTDSSMQDLGLFYSHQKEVFSIPDLDTGHYYLVYLNKADRDIGIRIDTKINSDTTHLTICKDRYNHEEENHLPLIMQLRNDENYTLKFASYGCFTSWEDSIQIDRNADKYYITYQKEKRELKIEEYEAIQRFEINLNHFERGGGCTTADYYTLVHYGISYKFVDESCEWNGSSVLWKQLNLKRK